VTDTETDIEMRAQATNNWSYQPQVHKVIQVDHCGAGDGNQRQGGHIVLPSATRRKRTYWDKPFGIGNHKMKISLDGVKGGECPGG
jgi:hypothetical protein